MSIDHAALTSDLFLDRAGTFQAQARSYGAVVSASQSESTRMGDWKVGIGDINSRIVGPAEKAGRRSARADMNMVDFSMAESDGGGNDEADFILDPKVQESIGRSLKAHYDDIVNAPVPDKFLVLLAQLEAQEHRAAAGDVSDERN